MTSRCEITTLYYTSSLNQPITHMVGGAITILKNMKINGKDDIPYMKWRITNVWNHQPWYWLFVSIERPRARPVQNKPHWTPRCPRWCRSSAQRRSWPCWPWKVKADVTPQWCLLVYEAQLTIEIVWNRWFTYVGGIPTPLKNMSSSVGMMTFTLYGK